MDHLTPVAEKFILHWGEMGTRWGINRTVAQIHALLFISKEPLNAEQITNLLGVARSNVSNSLKELQGWGIVRIVHVMGDRRDHFESLRDVWELFRQVLDERKKREIDPTVTLLRDCVAEAGRAGVAEKYSSQKLSELLGFFEQTTAWYEQIRRMPTAAVVKLVSLGEKVRKLIGA
jgi:DNA-binding transcriptional regulator GbsR (MarR family)